MPVKNLVSEFISYRDTLCFTPIAVDLQEQNPQLAPFVSRFFSLENFAEQIAEKRKSRVNRLLLHKALREQYQGIKASSLTTANIDSLRADETFTITTGHQLCLFTGPVYFIYKIVHAINLAAKLKEIYPNQHFVPVFWMASEDHDFAEVSSAKINGERVEWALNSKQAPVGRLQLNDFNAVINQFCLAFNDGPRAKELTRLIENCYKDNFTLAAATRLLVNELFGNYGLVILDGDHAELKREFAKVVAEDLQNQVSFKAISEVTEQLTKSYKPQIHPRSCNFFLFNDGARRRIDKTETGFELAETGIQFSETELLAELATNPENFSPNVALRPLYQEFTLPNLTYIGGGGELAYWLQLKGMFESFKVPFPMLALRNSVMLVGEDERNLLTKLQLQTIDVFQPEQQLAKKLVQHYEEPAFASLALELNAIKALYAKLNDQVGGKDSGLETHILAQLAKQEKFFKNLESKLVRVSKVKHAATLNKLHKLKQALFPGGGLQERSDNVFTFLFRNPDLIELLITELNPENESFTVINL